MIVVDWKEYKYITESNCRVDRELYERIVRGEIPLNDILQLKVLCYLSKLRDTTKKRKKQLELFEKKAYVNELQDTSHWIYFNYEGQMKAFILEDITDEKLDEYVAMVSNVQQRGQGAVKSLALNAIIKENAI